MPCGAPGRQCVANENPAWRFGDGRSLRPARRGTRRVGTHSSGADILDNFSRGGADSRRTGFGTLPRAGCELVHDPEKWERFSEKIVHKTDQSAWGAYGYGNTIVPFRRGRPTPFSLHGHWHSRCRRRNRRRVAVHRADEAGCRNRRSGRRGGRRPSRAASGPARCRALARLSDFRGQADGMLSAMQEREFMAQLVDPVSDKMQQPPYAKNWHRSIDPAYAVLVGVCTRCGCVPDYLEAESPLGMTGGYICPCCASHSDPAGRAYSSPASYNLSVPPHAIEKNARVLIGETGPRDSFSLETSSEFDFGKHHAPIKTARNTMTFDGNQLSGGAGRGRSRVAPGSGTRSLSNKGLPEKGKPRVSSPRAVTPKPIFCGFSSSN